MASVPDKILNAVTANGDGAEFDFPGGILTVTADSGSTFDGATISGMSSIHTLTLNPAFAAALSQAIGFRQFAGDVRLRSPCGPHVTQP